MLYRIALLFIPPFLFFFIMYGNPFTKVIIPIPSTDEKDQNFVNIPIPDLNKNFSPFLIAKILQIPLNLDWYKICLDNKTQILVNGEIPKSEGLNSGSIQVLIYNSDDSEQARMFVKKGIEDCLVIDGNNKFRTKFTYITEAWIPAGDNNMQADTEKTTFYIMPLMLAQILKHIAINIIWIGFLFFTFEIWKFIKGDKKIK